MENKDLMFDQSLQKLNVLFKLSGMNLQNKIKTIPDVIKYRWLFMLNLFSVALALVLCFYYLYIGIVTKKNVIELTSLAPCMTFSILALIKSYFHYANEGNISNLIEIIRKLERDECKRVASVEKRKIESEDRMFLNRVINVLYVLSCLMIVVFDMIPVLLMALKYHKTQEFEMMLPYLDVFAFVPYERKYWIMAYFHQIWSESAVLVEMGAADYLFFTCSTYIRTQFRLLQYDVETMIPPASEELLSDDEFRSKFSKLVIRHQEIIESTVIIEAIYSKSNLFNFLSSSLVICLTGFNVSVVTDVVTVVIFMTFLFMGLMQVFFLCWFSDLMTSASTEVSTAVYNSRWYLCRVAGSKALLLMQTRAQRPCAMSAAGFAEVNLRAFLRVLSTSWSYFALLQTVYAATDKSS